MRTGRTKDHARRDLEHNRPPGTMQLTYEAELETDA